MTEVDQANAGMVAVPRAIRLLVEDIYGGVFTTPIGEFKESILQKLRPIFRFGSAVWGSGAYSTSEMLSVSIVDQSPETIVAYASEWLQRDHVRQAVIAHPGRALRNEDVMPLDQHRNTELYRAFLKPARMEHALGMLDYNEHTDLGDFVFFFRPDPQDAFNAYEVSLLEYILPHLRTSWAQNQIAYHYRAAALGVLTSFHGQAGYAVADGQGLLHAAGDDFCIALRTAIPSWTGPVLPPELAAMLSPAAAASRVLGDFEFSVVEAGDRKIIAAACSERLGLTLAEFQVARLFADGMTQREIAAALDKSASTIRNQLASAYLKLGVHSKIDFARALSRLRT